jgi:hypothetical protein
VIGHVGERRRHSELRSPCDGHDLADLDRAGRRLDEEESEAYEN